MRKPNLIPDKPIYGGFCILELSKLHIYKLYYHNFKKYISRSERTSLHGHRLVVSFDSTEDIFSDMKKIFEDIFDFSNYPPHHFLHDNSNQGKLGYLNHHDRFAIGVVRQFLKSTKNNTTPETDLILKFEEEFSECRSRSDFQLGQYNSILDQTSDTLTLENSSLQEEGHKRSLPEAEGPRKRQV
ncbi:uncharacterized protein TNCV_1941071 [Trichonephila clavipes]|uniref:Uncharacterized protein n=1 Tax=Trichonephila clavipes TaxID=2585209 RepID=A0A8X6SHI3_TRICX|nr:uncharacterized protein TNCV_1941071 [Trichonephila clavipes]